MKKNSQAFVNQLLICLLVTMTCGGSIGLGTVWVRHQNSTTAKGNRVLAARIAEVERRNDELTTLIQGEQRPELLRRRNTEMRLGLVPMNEVPVVHVAENVTDRLVERANRELYSTGTDRARPAVVSLKIAAR
jgi:hypothetical protein